MAINFSNGISLIQEGGKISSPGRVIQVIETTNTSGMNTTSTSPVDFFTSAAITLTNANNYVLVELHSDNRSNDWGDGVWNLHFMDIIHTQSGTQLSSTGYVGEQTLNIRHVHRTGIHRPLSVGPHTYKCRGWSYPAGSQSTTFGTGSDGTPAYLRLTEIAF
jgi:hypothetical protein